MKSSNLYQPPKNSHKGQNGKLLVIGGSKLFHSSIFWSADVASRIVDLVHLTSPANENNQIFRKKLKEKFWNGIVVDWGDVEEYIKEDDCVLIGPGMVRSDPNLRMHPNVPNQANSYNSDVHSDHSDRLEQLEKWARQDKTKEVVNYLLSKYPTKRWVIDGGALQEVDVKLIAESCILTPHRKEFTRLWKRVFNSENSENSDSRISSENQTAGDPEDPTLRFSDILTLRSSEYSECSELSKKLNSCTILLKGPIDIVCQGDRCVKISGGNPGMTKGGTGDVLAGLVAAFYTKNDSWIAATMASYVNKKAGDQLYKKVGPYFNAADLVAEVPKVLAKFAKPVASREVSQTSPLTIYGIMGEDVPTQIHDY